MFSLGNHIGQEIGNLRKSLGLTKVELAKLSGIKAAKTIHKIETEKSKGKIETFIRIRNAIKENFNIDLFEKTGIRIIWDFKDLNKNLLNIIEGGLLGDGCVSTNGNYLQEAKDRKYLEWLGKLLDKDGVKYKIVATRSKSSYSKSKKSFYRLYTHCCPAFLEFRRKWYISSNQGKRIKRVPKDIKLSSITLLHWYLGDGNFKRDNRELPRGGRPCVRLFTNGFLREDVEFLLRRLKESLDLNFYILPKFNKYKEKGHSLHLHPKDLFKFFKIVGLEPPQEIKNSITKEILIGKAKGRVSTFEGKWPNKADWIRILAKTESIGKLLKEKRKRLSLTQREMAGKINVTQHHVSEIETGRKYIGSKRFEKVLDLLKLNINKLLDNLYINN